MDWFSWLSKTGLEPSLVYEYGLAFAHNELEEEDIAYFNHEFLQSVGVSIAKHRLEILKLAEKEGGRRPPPMSRLIAMVKKTKRCLAKCIHAWVHRNDSAIIVVPAKAYGKRWRGALLKRNKRMMMVKQASKQLMITDGSVGVGGMQPLSTGASPIVQYDLRKVDEVYDDPCWSNGTVEEIRWASMFQDLKPT